MLKQVRQNIIAQLWERYRDDNPHMQLILTALKKKGITCPALDHFAVIDLPSVNTGISELKRIFSILGYIERGKDYLPSKQNDFLWMAEDGCQYHPAADALPQVVVADFRLEELPLEVKDIIEKYANQTKPSPQKRIEQLAEKVQRGDTDAAHELTTLVVDYFTGADWPLPTVKEFHTVQLFNELIAWVLVFGRRPNHFTISTHLLSLFDNIADFHDFIENDLHLPLNLEGGKIKGGPASGIAQGSTKGIRQTIQLSDGVAELPNGFVEFVWRFPRETSCSNPKNWGDYFTDFIPQHANKVIESLYEPEKKVILSDAKG